MMPRWDTELFVIPLLLALGVLVVIFGIALFVEWYRGWPGWPMMRDRKPRA
jgi:hypothetical protein